MGGSWRAPLLPALLRCHRLATFQQRLEIAEDPGPSTTLSRPLLDSGDHRRMTRCPGEVMNHAEPAQAALALLDFAIGDQLVTCQAASNRGIGRGRTGVGEPRFAS